MSEAFERYTVGDIVAADFRAGGVFEKFGIDFCCGGRRSVAEACRTAAVDPAEVERALEALTAAGKGDDDVTKWTLDRLIDHILDTHHSYVRGSQPLITKYLAKLVEVHGARHPELVRIAATFQQTAQGLTQHMMKEEQVLFPYIREIATSSDRRHTPSPFGTVENPIRMMEREHEEAGDEMRLIRELTHGYEAPADGCTTYRVCFSEFAQFERDLHRHVHLENNVLFPRAIEIEQRFAMAGKA